MLTFGMPTLIEVPRPEDMAALAASLGLGFAEINMSFPQFQPEALSPETLNSLREKYGVFFTVHMDEALDPCSVNPGIARVYSDTAVKTAALARAAGIPTLNMHLLRGVYVTLPTRRTYIYAENEELYLTALSRFRDRMTDAIGDSGIKLCVENTDGFDLPFLAHAVDCLLESPAFGLTYDVGHDEAIAHRDAQFLSARASRLHHMHLHDADGSRVHLALGDGKTEPERYLRMAEEHDMRVVLETKTVEALKSSVRWLRDRGWM